MPDVIGTKYSLCDDSFSIQYMRRKGYSVMPRPHAHPFYEIYYLLQGERIYFMNGGVYTARRGDMIIVNPNDLHSTASSEVPEFERLLIHFHHHFVDASDFPLLPFERGSRLVRFSLKEQPEIERMMKEMLTECEERQPGTETCVKALMTKLLVFVYRRMQQTINEAPQYAHPMHQKISEITAYMNVHYASDLTLEQTAKQFYISPSYLSRIFMKLTGFHFREYLQIIRIREAQKLLAGSKDKIQQIAERVGFEQISHFNKTFKKHSGVPPLRYRRQHKADNGKATALTVPASESNLRAAETKSPQVGSGFPT